MNKSNMIQFKIKILARGDFDLFLCKIYRRKVQWLGNWGCIVQIVWKNGDEREHWV